MDSFIFFAILLIIVLLATPIAVIILFVKSRGKHHELQQQIDRLRDQLAEIQQRAPVDDPPPVTDDFESPAKHAAPDAEYRLEPDQNSQSEYEPAPAVAAASMPPAAASISDEPPPPRRGKNPFDHFEDILRRCGENVLRYFTDGNLFVRIGLLVLFFGVAFLLKFAAESDAIPLEIRFMGAALGGIGLMLFGWRLRRSKPVYALLLQGGGVGITYITIFTAFRLAHLIPSTLTFALLVLFAVLTIALAILQNSRALAVYALIGGFLAPLLASTGSGNYVGLFSYYSVLNAAVFGIAWFRAWRVLNLLGFVFTFGVFALWMGTRYIDTDLVPALIFLAIFFLMYSLIGVLYALRQPQNMTGLVDGTLVFGTPVIVSGLLMVMLRDYEFGIAGATAGMGVYYLVLARYAWHRVGEPFRLLAEAMLAIGVVFVTLAIPYALDGHWSTAAWALEAAGILWVSIRQKRFYAQCFAVLLQVGAGVMFLLRNVDDIGFDAWLNPAFLGGVFIALGAFVSSRMLYLQDKEFRLRLLHLPFFLWGMAWWLGSVLVQIDAYIDHRIIVCLLLFGGTAYLLVYLDRIRLWNWRPAAFSGALLLPVLVILALISTASQDHVLVAPDAWFWLAMLTANYWIITKLENVDWLESIRVGQHVAFVVFTALLFSHELYWLVNEYLSGYGKGYRALIAAVPLLAIYAAQNNWYPAINRLGSTLQLGIIVSLSAVLTLWSLVINATNSGNPGPLPYIPFLNPVDLAHLVFFMLVIASLKLVDEVRMVQRDQLLVVLAGLVFVWLTAVLIRSMHHYLGIPFDLSDLLRDTRVQTAISILWTIIGIGAMWFASRRSIRSLWLTGASLVGVVLIKMFFIDLGAGGTVERIVSFLVVGSLLVATGYFSPIPPRADETEHDSGERSHA